MSQPVYHPSTDSSERAWFSNLEEYRAKYERSIADPEAFWADLADSFVWKERWGRVCDYDFSGEIDIRWFVGGQTNVSVNAIDRHLESRGDQVAILWEGNEPGEESKLTFSELHREVCRFANVLKSRGVKKGDRVSP